MLVNYNTITIHTHTHYTSILTCTYTHAYSQDGYTWTLIHYTPTNRHQHTPGRLVAHDFYNYPLC